MKKKYGLLGACMLSVGISVNASDGLARPFGVDMGEAGSCVALPNKLREIDNRIINSPPEGTGPQDPGIFYYSPLDKVFPGARNHLFVVCTEGRIRHLSFAVEKGPGNSLLLQVLTDLDRKYERSSLRGLVDPATHLREGGRTVFISANTVAISVSSSKSKDFFSVTYEYTGTLTDRGKELQRQQDDQTLIRRRAL